MPLNRTPRLPGPKPPRKPKITIKPKNDKKNMSFKRSMRGY